MENKNQKLYTCPMHPEIQQEYPGICPECGMALIVSKRLKTKSEKHAGHEEYDKHAGHSTQMFLRKFWVNLALTIPVLAYSDVVQKVFGFIVPEFAGSNYLPLIFGSIVFFYGGWVFLVGAWRELKARLPGMMTLIGIAISAAYFYSVYATFSAPGQTLFWELTTLVTIMLLGHWLEMKAVASAQSALKELSKLLPDVAEIIRGGVTQTVPLAEVKEGDLTLVRPGGRVPADGVIIEGRAEVNESMITGESAPVAKNLGDQVIAGTINGDGLLKVKVTKVGEHTFLAGVMRLVAEAQSSKSQLQILSDRAALWLTIIALVAGGLTFLTWFWSKADFGFAIERLVAVLVIACPHALGLAVPLVASISTTMAARSGFLVRQRLALELARKIDVVLFDKTGTLTKGDYGVTKIWSVEAVMENEVLQLAASLDAYSEHFISKAIVAEAKKRNLPLLPVRDFSRLPGRGVKGKINGQELFVGGVLTDSQVTKNLPEPISAEIEKESNQGKTVIYISHNGAILGVIALADLIREESRQAIKELKAMGVKISMVTGDSFGVAKWAADQLGIDEFFAKVLPDQKADKVKLLQSKGLKVAMVGDGINDAPALAQADLGIAIGAGTNVAIEAAGIILVRNDPRDIVKIIKLSRLTYGKMVQNLFWATGYNIIALPLAAGVLISKGIILEPALAALFMSLSTVIVAINAVFLRQKKL